MRRLVATVILDILTGLSALLVFLVADSIVHVGADTRVGLFVLALLCLAAGLIRGGSRPRNPWVKGLAVSSGLDLVLLLLAWNSIPPAVGAMLLFVAVLFTVCGVSVRHLLGTGSVRTAAAVAFLSMAAVAFAAAIAVPRVIDAIATHRTVAPAPEFAMTRLDGTPVRSTDLRGSVVVIDFWATWCPACRRELPELEELYAQYRATPHVSFLAVDVDQGGETPAKAGDFMRQRGYLMPVVFDDRKAADVLLRDHGFPSLLILDKAGRIRLTHTGYDQSERLRAELSAEIDTLLKE